MNPRSSTKRCSHGTTQNELSAPRSMAEAYSHRLRDCATIPRQRMRISVIIATRRRPHFLEETLRSLAAADTAGLDWELLVADNGGDAETRRVLDAATGLLPA